MQCLILVYNKVLGLEKRSSVAQFVELLTCNQGVAGFNPTVGVMCPRARHFYPHCLIVFQPRKHINPSLILVQPRKTRPEVTERLLTGT